MKNLNSLISSTLIALVSIAAASARAELPPEAYEELLKDAQEVLNVRVTHVQMTPGGEGDMLQVLCDATILAVERSKADLKPGDKIRFESYALAPAARRRGWVGPALPPQLLPGQTWRVSLNAGDEPNKPYKLAAYGRSFQRIVAPAILGADARPRLGVTAAPTAGGGMRISSVAPRSIADKLGLRPGDRVRKINDSEINAASDVAEALEKNAEQVEIEFDRAGEPIELVLRLTAKGGASESAD